LQSPGILIHHLNIASTPPAIVQPNWNCEATECSGSFLQQQRAGAYAESDRTPALSGRRLFLGDVVVAFGLNRRSALGFPGNGAFGIRSIGHISVPDSGFRYFFWSA
jgi:hypothetical protein